MAAEKEIVLTKEGLEQLEDKLQYLRSYLRKEIAERIRQAKEFGEIEENAELVDAKSEQARIEGEIMRLENIVMHARVLDKKEITTDVVSLGSIVSLRDMATDGEEEYQIVGTREANPLKGKISNESPVGASLIGCKKNQVIEVNAPGGVAHYKILKIRKRATGH